MGQGLCQPRAGRRPLWHLDLSPVGPVLDVWPAELYGDRLMLAEAQSLCSFIFGSSGSGVEQASPGGA